MKSFQKYTELASLVVLDASMMKPMLLTTTGQCPNFHAGTDDPYKLCERCGCFTHAIPDSYAIIPPSIKAHTCSAFCSSHPPSWACETWTLAQLLARLLRLSSAQHTGAQPLPSSATLLVCQTVEQGTCLQPRINRLASRGPTCFVSVHGVHCSFFFLRHNALKELKSFHWEIDYTPFYTRKLKKL